MTSRLNDTEEWISDLQDIGTADRKTNVNKQKRKSESNI